MTPAAALWIGALGAAGSLCRAGLGEALAPHVGKASWLPTLLINLAGSFLMGLAVAALGPERMRSTAGAGLTVGFLGGFTTYSAFAYQTVDLLERKATGVAALYVALTLAGGALACAAGLLVGRAARG